MYAIKEEKISSKTSDMTSLTTDTTKYPNCKAVADYVAAAAQVTTYNIVYNETDKKHYIEGLDDSVLYTTFKSLIEAKKDVVLIGATGDRYLMSFISSSYIQFRFAGLANYNSYVGIKYFNVTPSGGLLGAYAIKAEGNANKVTDMTDLTEDTTKFPNCKAVADYVTAKTKTYTAGTGIQISEAGVISLALANANGGNF